MIFLRIDDTRCSMDVYGEFEKLMIDGRDITRMLIEKIESGKYLSPYQFVDRFNHYVDVSDMSMGCKAALLVVYRPDMEINLSECGDNAIGTILSNITEGKVSVHPDVRLSGLYYEDPSMHCDVGCMGYRFTNMGALSAYLTDFYPYPLPYLSDGVEELEPHDLSGFASFLKPPWFSDPGTRIS